MSILLLASYPGSLMAFRGALLNEFLQRGEEVHVATPGMQSNVSLKKSLQSKGVIVHDIKLRRTGMNPIADLRVLIELIILMRQIRPDRVLCYTVKPIVYGMLAAEISRVKGRYALVTGLGYGFQGDSRRFFLRWILRGMFKISLRNATKVFFQNSDDESLFKKLGLLKKSIATCVVNGSGVDLNYFNCAPLPDKARFLFVGRFIGDKGVREYVEAARKVKIEYSEVEFCLAGWIDENPDSIKKVELDKWISEYGIRCLGKLDDVRAAITGCSVFVLPSYREGTPRTVLEAMAMGRPIITTDAPGCRETTVDGDNGFLVPIKNTNKLASTMCKFIDDPSLIKRMGIRSRKVAESKYDVNKVNLVILREMGFCD